MRRLRVVLLQYPHDLLELFHKVELGVQSTGRIHNQHVSAACLSRLHRVVNDRAWIRAMLVAHNRHTNTLAPSTQLFRGRRAKRVARGEQHTMFLPLQEIRQLGDAGRLPNAIDPHHEKDTDRRRIGKYEWLGIAKEQRQLFLECLAQLSAGRQVLRLHTFVQQREQPLRRLYANITSDHRFFQLIPKVISDFFDLQCGVHAAKELAGSTQAEFEWIVQKAAPLVRDLFLRRFFLFVAIRGTSWFLHSATCWRSGWYARQSGWRIGGCRRRGGMGYGRRSDNFLSIAACAILDKSIGYRSLMGACSVVLVCLKCLRKLGLRTFSRELLLILAALE